MSAPRLYVTGVVRCQVRSLCWRDRGVRAMHRCWRSVSALSRLSTDHRPIVTSLGSVTVLTVVTGITISLRLLASRYSVPDSISYVIHKNTTFMYRDCVLMNVYN